MTLTNDQQILESAAERYLRENYDFNQRRARVEQGIYCDTNHWKAFADLGWLSLLLPESMGGLGLGYREIAILAELCGKYLVTEPLIDSALATSTLLAPTQRSNELLPLVMKGEMIPIPALDEPYRSRRKHPGTLLEKTSSSWRLRGEKVWVGAGASGTHYVVSATGPEGLVWVLITASQEGVSLDTYPTHDGRGGASLQFDTNIEPNQILLNGEKAKEAQTVLKEQAMILGSAETLGAMQAALDATVDYTKQREQFGQPLASFQALQHRMADMLIQIELARSLVYAACHAADKGSIERGRFALASKVKTAAVGKRVTQEAIQLHGGIATTDECIVGHFFKRVTALESWLCSRGEALQEFVQLESQKFEH